MNTERPILFNAPMIRALLDGSKTQTRRTMKRQPEFPIISAGDPHMNRYQIEGREPMTLASLLRECPYGQPGNRMWVREAYADIGCRLTYRADEDDGAHCNVKKWTPSIHMFRADSRILLEITSVRVDRLQSITESDARAEGISDGGCTNCGEPELCGCANPAPDARDAFCHLWGQINGPDSWSANPWCWAITFKRVTL